jgi:hypothetical protein
MRREKEILKYSAGTKLTDVVPRMPKRTNRTRAPPSEIELSSSRLNKGRANEDDMTGKDIYNSNSNLYRSGGSSSEHLEDV